ncbi:MMS19 nucleotide excision repair protein-like protein [Striga asiatica]|uniref:MMS19 nucleotide excision repair protein n=1 Tax=Striga asiatica TaxID=4170 RepID=A0A5A7R6X9_STRAF|nr:MMS19 nucleotide excision repair protein-like protein [Striga asiatica]
MDDVYHPWMKHIDLYIDGGDQTQQAASVDAIATLLKNESITLEDMVRAMKMDLTSALDTRRYRAMLFLAKVLESLSSKPLSSTSIHSLLVFFAERLADWKALRGALVGCLALLRRKTDVGIVTNHDVLEVTRSFLENLRLQSMAQYERKLSLQVIECLLDRYSDALVDLGDNLLYGFCEAIDGERDPECLLLIFRMVERLAQLYPANLEDYAEELFGILVCVSVTGDPPLVALCLMLHILSKFEPATEANDVKREELSRALMVAFGSTDLYEPFAIPLLLEKLSSSLPSTKVESFKFLTFCIATYSRDRIYNRAEVLWSIIKDETYVSPQSTLSKDLESMGQMSFQETDVMNQAFILLQEIIRRCDDSIQFVIHDNDINVFINSLNEYKEFDAIPLQIKQRLHAVGRILSTCAETSVASCDKVFKSFFPLLMCGLEISVGDSVCPVQLNFGALYLCIQLLASSRYLSVSLENCGSTNDFSNWIWSVMVSNFSKPLVEAFVSIVRPNVADNSQSHYVHLGVKGLKVLATFPGRSSPLSKSIYDNILRELLGVVASDSANTFLWKLALKALVDIGISIDNCPDTEKAASFESIVVEKIVSLLSFNDSTMPSAVKLHAAFEIGATRKDFMMRVVKMLDEAIRTNFSEAYNHGNPESDKLMVNILDTYSRKVFPWSFEFGGVEEVSLNFALVMWDKIEDIRTLYHNRPDSGSDVLGATMITMKKAVAGCSKESQDIIIKKAFGVVFSKEEVSQQAYTLGASSGSNEWLTSLLASVVVALRPETSIPNGKKISHLFITSILNGHVPSAHALGSLVNKIPLDIKSTGSSDWFSLNELDMILSSFIKTSGDDSYKINFGCLRQNALPTEVEINAIIGLAWIGKGLLMRGHEKAKDVTMALLSFLMQGGTAEVLDREDSLRLMMSAGDAFRVIMGDSEECLNRMCHAIARPLYKQRFFSTVVPILSSLVMKAESSIVRSMLYRAYAHVISDTPLSAVLVDARKVVPMLSSCLCTLMKDVENKEITYKVVLVISGILMDKNGEDAAVENAPNIVDRLIELVTYPHMMAVRETAIQCLVAVSQLPHTRIYPLRTKVLQATAKALDDPKRIVRMEAVRCRHAWSSWAHIVGIRKTPFWAELLGAHIDSWSNSPYLSLVSGFLVFHGDSMQLKSEQTAHFYRSCGLLSGSVENMEGCNNKAESLREDSRAQASEAQPEDIERKARIDAMWQQMNKGVSPKTLKSILENKGSAANKSSQKTPVKKSSSGWMNYLGLGSKKESPVQGQLEKPPSITQNGASEDTKRLAAAALSAVKDAAALATLGSGKVEIKEVRDFAGEEIEVKKLIDADSKEAAEKGKSSSTPCAVDAVLEQIKKKPKLSVLDKTKKDWGEYKDENKGLEEELDAYKKSSNQYLDRLSFLQRADYREFERERDARLALQAKRKTDMRDDL